MSYFLRQMKKYPGEFHIATGGQKRSGIVRRRTSALIQSLEPPADTLVGFTFGLATEGAAAEAILPRLLPLGEKVGTVSSTFLEGCRIVELAESIRPDGRHVVKACFQHRVTKEVVFISACNNFIGEESRVAAREEGWYICNADIVAPGRFWINAKAKIHM